MKTAILIGLPFAWLVAAAPVPRADAGPKKSADVVRVKLERGSIADGLESFHVWLTIAEGWQVYANPVGVEALAEAATTAEFYLDGKSAATSGISYWKGSARKAADGTEYRAYEGKVSYTAWLLWADTEGAEVISVRVKVVATDGKTRLKESIVTAEVGKVK